MIEEAGWLAGRRGRLVEWLSLLPAIYQPNTGEYPAFPRKRTIGGAGELSSRELKILF